MSDIERLEKSIERMEVNTGREMIQMAQAIKELGKSMNQMATNQAVNEERILRVIEDNQRRDIRITGLEKKTATMERISGLNTYAVGIAPKMFYSLIGALGSGAAITYGIVKIMDKI